MKGQKENNWNMLNEFILQFNKLVLSFNWKLALRTKRLLFILYILYQRLNKICCFLKLHIDILCENVWHFVYTQKNSTTQI